MIVITHLKANEKDGIVTQEDAKEKSYSSAVFRISLPKPAKCFQGRENK